MESEPSLWELSRLITRVETGLRDDITEVRNQISGLRFVDQQVWEAEKRALEWRVSALEERARRSWYLAMSAFIAPLVVGVVLALLMRPGGLL